MKTFRITCFILLISLAGLAQEKRKLVADETELIEMKSGVKLETSSEGVFKLLLSAFKEEGFRYTALLKKDRRGFYFLYSVKFKDSQREQLTNFLKHLDE